VSNSLTKLRQTAPQLPAGLISYPYDCVSRTSRAPSETRLPHERERENGRPAHSANHPHGPKRTSQGCRAHVAHFVAHPAIPMNHPVIKNGSMTGHQAVDLVGLLSNPVGPLKTVLERELPDSARLRLPSEEAAPISSQHRRAGWIVDAIVRVLAEQGEPMQAKEVHAAVEKLLGERVRWSSVKAALAANIAGPSSRFVRIARGRYVLAN
jgi:hypothetical protein